MKCVLFCFLGLLFTQHFKINLHDGMYQWASLVAQMNPGTRLQSRELSSVPGLGRSPGERNGYPLQYSCLEDPMDRGVLWAIVHGVAKSWTGLSD